MSIVQQIEAQIAKLSPAEFGEIVRWIAERDAELWDKQIAEDAAAGRLDALWGEAKKEIATGEARPLDDILDHP